MRSQLRKITMIAAFACGLVAVVPYVARQYQRAQMKETITAMRTLATALDSEHRYLGTCAEAAKAAQMQLQCSDAWGESLHLRQSRTRPDEYVIWCQGRTPATARFVYQQGRFTVLPKNAPP